ncbi:MAG TPA: biopolymer transporter ExbD [Paludibacter sp.]|nr:biopolymer transporter ExbD [Paludibacter sp.]
MKIERRKERTAEVYTSSLNDIMFFLLLFFLIISTLATPATIQVLLPKSKTSSDVVVKKQINLTITAEHKYYIEKKEITFEEIEPQLSTLVSKKTSKEEVIVLLHADKSLNLQDAVNVIDIGNKLKVKMILFTKKNKG